MRAPGERPQMEFRGLKRRAQVVGAILVLERARPPALRQACALIATMADHCLMVAVDGGLEPCLAGGRRPDLFVGDGDAERRVPAETATVVCPSDKETSDLSRALAELRARKVQVVAAAGLLGGRLDHDWANLLELGHQSRWFAGIVAPTERATVLVTSRGCQAATVRKRVFSLLALTPSSTVTLLGTEHEFERRRLRPGVHGLGNRTGTHLDLTVHSGSVALVLLPPSARAPRRRRSAKGRVRAAPTA